ncbi:MAG: FAD-binding protein [Pirellula sp.]
MSNHPSVADSRVVALQESIRGASRVHIVGSQSKGGFHSGHDSVCMIDSQALIGVVAYDPQEFVVTVLAGTPVSDLVRLVHGEGQYLPFDPLLSDRGATIGGTVASNAAGPGRFRFGGIRDFLIGIRFIDGYGKLIRGGGQVVKNAAGFDYPKLMVGSRGTLGMIVELTFKVFPKPESFATVMATFLNIDEAISKMNSLVASPLDLEAVDLIPRDGGKTGYELAIRFGGLASAIPNRIHRLQQLLPNHRILQDDEETKYWRDVSNFRWCSEQNHTVKLPVTPGMIASLEKQLTDLAIGRRYSVGGNVAWLDMSQAIEVGQEILQPILSKGQPFLCTAHPNATLLQRDTAGPFGGAIKRAIDPHSKFV